MSDSMTKEAERIWQYLSEHADPKGEAQAARAKLLEEKTRARGKVARITGGGDE